MYRLVSFALLFFIPNHLLSQIFPTEGSKLNYRLVGFSFPQMKGGKYTLEIAAGYYSNTDSFNRNIIKPIDCNTNKIIAEIPAFGNVYTWRVVPAGKHSVKSTLHHFSTLASPKTDTAISRLRIISKAKKYKDAYVFIDRMQAMYDMEGKPVWFLPDTSYLVNKISNAIDMKLSPEKTITFIMNDKIKEVNYRGTVLWIGPNTGEVSGDTSEYYHHEFTRLMNGHYMVMGNEEVAWPLPDYKPDSNMETDILRDSNNVYRQKLKFGTIIEYDEKGRVVWAWKSSGYFKHSDVYKYKTEKGRFQVMDVHENSFFFDERSRVIYVSCRDINQVLKVKYPDGKVTAVYGNRYNADNTVTENVLFSGQHSVKISGDGNLYLFNNNVVPTERPKLMVMQEPYEPGGDLKTMWEYVCTPDGMTDHERAYYENQKERIRMKDQNNNRKKVHFTSGGNVMELPDQSIFASMNGPSSKVFIVTKDKEIIWSAIPEQKDANDTLWEAAPIYRASIIADKKDLEELIWKSEGKKGQ